MIMRKKIRLLDINEIYRTKTQYVQAIKESLSKTWFLDQCLDKSTTVSHHQISLFNIRNFLRNKTSKHANKINIKYAIFRGEYHCISIYNILILTSLTLLRQTPYYYPKIERKKKKVSKLNLISSGMLLCVLFHYI